MPQKPIIELSKGQVMSLDEFEKELKENSHATPTPLISEQPTLTLGNLSNNSLYMRRKKKMIQNKSN